MAVSFFRINNSVQHRGTCVQCLLNMLGLPKESGRYVLAIGHNKSPSFGQCGWTLRVIQNRFGAFPETSILRRKA